MQKIDITEQEAPQRIDRFLTKYLNQTNKSTVYRLLRKKLVRVNGKRIKENYMLEAGDLVQIYLADDSFAELREEPKQMSPQKAKLDIVFEDEEILVVHKPAGLLTHPDKTEYKKTLATRVQQYLAHLAGKTFRPAPIQRLDKNTSGLVLFAKTYNALQEYNRYMRERKLGKFYYTIVEGKVDKSGVVKGFLVKDEWTNKVTLSKEEGSGLFVHTGYKPLEYKKGYTLLEVELFTGRSHQIRASLDWIKHPIVGDVKYGGKKVNGQTTQLLHAWKLVLPNGNEIKHISPDIETFWEEL